MEYTSVELLQRLGALINRIQRVRETIPVDMERGDARHVALSGIQTCLCPLMLAFGALEFTNWTTDGKVELSKVCGLNQPNEKLLSYFDTWAKLNLIVFTQFKFENLISDLLAAFDSSYNQRTGFSQKLTDLFAIVGVPDADEKKKCFTVMALLRNSLHNNSINKNGNHDIVISGTTFVFENEKPTRATIQDVLFIVEQAVEVAAELLAKPGVVRLPAPIPNRFQIEIGQWG